MVSLVSFFMRKSRSPKFPQFCPHKKSHKYWDDKETTVTPHQLSLLGGIETLSTSRPQKPHFGRILSFPICRIYFNFTSWNTFYHHQHSRDKTPSHVNLTRAVPHNLYSLVFKILPHQQFSAEVSRKQQNNSSINSMYEKCSRVVRRMTASVTVCLFFPFPLLTV